MQLTKTGSDIEPNPTKAYGVGTWIFLLCGMLACALVGCTSHKYYEESKLIGEKVLNELTGERICSDRQDCVRRQILFFSGEGKGVQVSVYGITNPIAIGKVVNAVLVTQSSIAKPIDCKVLFFRNPKEKNTIWGNDPFVVVEIKGDK